MAGTEVANKTFPDLTDLDKAVSRLRGETLGLMLYGSHARGDAREASDVDILRIADHSPTSCTDGVISVTSYTPEQLTNMVRTGSLFAWHLRTEGIPITDDAGLLVNALSSHPGPAYSSTLDRIRDLSAVIDLSRREFISYANRAIRTARYLTRTAVYARAIESGGNSFSMDQAVIDAKCPHILPLFRRSIATASDWTTFQEYRELLNDLIGHLTSNPFKSLESLAVNEWYRDRQLASLAIQTMIQRPGEIEYSTLPPPVL